MADGYPEGTSLLTTGGILIDTFAGTLAQLQALGTNRGVSATAGSQSVGWDTTNLRWLYCLTAAAGSSTWGYKRSDTLYPRCDSTSASNALRYCSWASPTVGTLITALGMGILFKHPTVVKSATFYVTNNPGDVAIATYKNGGAALESIVETVAAATAKDFAFTALSTFAANETFHISIDPVNARTASEVTFLSVEIEETITAA